MWQYVYNVVKGWNVFVDFFFIQYPLSFVINLSHAICLRQVKGILVVECLLQLKFNHKD